MKIEEKEYFENSASSAVRRNELDRVAKDVLDVPITEPLTEEEQDLVSWACNRIKKI